MRFTRLGLGLILGLSACATAPRIDVTDRGEPPSAARAHTFQIVISNVGERQTALGAAIARRLQQAHLTPAAAAPDLTVEGVYSLRPGVVGAYATPPATAATWLDRPLQPSWLGRTPDLESVAIVVTDTRSGRELYRTRATKALNGKDPSDISGLVDAALSGAPASAGR